MSLRHSVARTGSERCQNHGRRTHMCLLVIQHSRKPCAPGMHAGECTVALWRTFHRYHCLDESVLVRAPLASSSFFSSGSGTVAKCQTKITARVWRRHGMQCEQGRRWKSPCQNGDSHAVATAMHSSFTNHLGTKQLCTRLRPGVITL